MTITDIITILLSTFLVFNGFNRGFLSSLLGPLSLILSSIFGFLFFISNPKTPSNIAICLSIGLFGPFILGWLLRSIVQSWFSMSGTQASPSFISRIFGAILSLSWGLVMLVITVLLLAMIPAVEKPFRLDLLFKDIHNSHLYQLIKPLDSFAIDAPNSQVDLKALSEDKRIQEIVNDPLIIEAINRKDYSSLLSNPKIAALMQDPKLMKQILGAYRQMMQEKMNSETPTSNSTSPSNS